MASLQETLRDMYMNNTGYTGEVPTGDPADVLVFYACFSGKNLDVLLSANTYREYLAATHDDDPVMRDLMSRATISLFKTKLPFSYESNKGLHIAFLPGLELAYSSSSRSIIQAKGVVKFDKALSYVLDTHIFNTTKSYFQEELNKLAVLDSFQPTAGITSYCKREHLGRLFILTEEIRLGLIPGDANIILSDITHGRYDSVIRKQAGSIDYPKLMLACPDSVKSKPFYDWLRIALMTEGITLNIPQDTEELGIPEDTVIESKSFDNSEIPIETNLEHGAPTELVNKDNSDDVKTDAHAKLAFFEKFINKPDKVIPVRESATEELKQDAWNYAIKLGFNANIIAERLGENKSEVDAYRSVPQYIKDTYHKVDTVEYAKFEEKYK